MKSRPRRRWTWLVLACVAMVTPAIAQRGGAGGPDPSAEVGLTRQVTLSPREQVAQAERLVARMEAGAASVRRQLAVARARNDVVKVLCLNDKLNQSDVAVRTAREHFTTLRDAANHGDAELSQHEFSMINVLRSRSDQIMAEANQCIGEESAFIGETAVTSTVDPSIPREDPTESPTQPITGVTDPPPCTSCIL